MLFCYKSVKKGYLPLEGKGDRLRWMRCCADWAARERMQKRVRMNAEMEQSLYRTPPQSRFSVRTQIVEGRTCMQANKKTSQLPLKGKLRIEVSFLVTGTR